jgi:putative phosphoribosyl transferase
VKTRRRRLTPSSSTSSQSAICARSSASSASVTAGASFRQATHVIRASGSISWARLPPDALRIVPWIPPLFHDRAAAGRVLAEAVGAVELVDPVVVGVARGGVAVAVEVARALDVPVTAVDVERVNAGGRRLGAVTASGPPYLRDDAPEAALERARRDAAALEARLEHEQLPVAGRTAIVVDDGVITGLTLAAACRWARAEEVARLVAATPVGHVAGLERLRPEADAVVCPHPLDGIAVVGQAYESFDPLDEWYVASLLADA